MQVGLLSSLLPSTVVLLYIYTYHDSFDNRGIHPFKPRPKEVLTKLSKYPTTVGQTGIESSSHSLV